MNKKKIVDLVFSEGLHVKIAFFTSFCGNYAR